MRPIHIISTIIVAIVIGLSSSVTHAQGQYSGEYIRSYNVDITVEESGKIMVSETILYDFGSKERHGIFRTIPYTIKNENGTTYAMEIGDISLTDEAGVPYSYTDEDDGSELTFKIGDPDSTITGVHTYIIGYSVAGALRYFQKADELYWNAVGTKWEVPIQQSSVHVTLPKTISESDIEFRCFKGPVESNLECLAKISGHTLQFDTTDLAPAEGMTVVVQFPTGVVAVLEPEEVVDFGDTLLGKIVGIGVVVTALTWYLLYPLWLPFKWYRDGRDPSTRSGPVTASFDPPKLNGRKLTPAETGALIDEDVNIRELAATIVHLAQRGHFKIIEKKQKEFELVKVETHPNGDMLLPFEMYLINGLFVSGGSVKLKNAQLASTMESVETSIYEQLIQNNYFPHNPKSVRKTYALITGLAIITFNILLAMSAGFFGRIMPRKTLSGKEASHRAVSLKSFLESQERQLEFQVKADLPAGRQVMFEKLLPYAIAFGVEKIWAERFKDLTLKSTDWYQTHSTDALTAGLLTNNLASSFAPAFKSATTPATSSSGFSSGMSGGSSGGGGGGGGGGSW